MKHRRATFAGARETRRLIVRAGCALFAEKGLPGVSVAEVAAAAKVFPNQITYYFGSKDALFAEVASRLILEAAAAAEQAGSTATSPQDYVRALGASILGPGMPAVLAFVEAMLLARRRPELTAAVTATIARLHREGERAIGQMTARAGWHMRASARAATQNFWMTVLGLALQRAATGADSGIAAAEALSLLESNLVEPDPKIRPIMEARQEAGGGLP